MAEQEDDANLTLPHERIKNMSLIGGFGQKLSHITKSMFHEVWIPDLGATCSEGRANGKGLEPLLTFLSHDCLNKWAFALRAWVFFFLFLFYNENFYYIWN